jgi:isoleucyl-tRNA synthetase
VLIALNNACVRCRASEDFEEIVAVGSVQELFELSGVRVEDLHKDIVDDITIPSKTGRGTLRRIDEVFDCWFESGSMPYAQLHYPFENKERFEKGFPADFIAEGLDQTRGWFYTLMVIATCLFDKPAFKNLIVNGLVLAADGKKMSKRLKNYPDPMVVLDSYGADALRLYLIDSPVVCAEVLRFTEAGVNDVVRNVLLPWYNAFRFYIQCLERWELHAGATFKPDSEVAYSSSNDVDIWILAAVTGLVKFVHQEMAAYRLYTVVPRLVGFIEELTNWYVRLNRDRIKGGSGEAEATLGLHVLTEVLVTMTTIMAPFTPFFAEYLYQHLRKRLLLYKNTDAAIPIDALGKSDSVHYLMLPVALETRLNPRAEARFKTLQEAVKLSRTARERRHIRNNLPLKSVVIVAANEEVAEALTYLRSYFLSEVNAWDMEVSSEWEKMCVIKTVPNWKDLGKRLGKKMKDVAKAITDLTQQQIVDFMAAGTIELCGFTLNTDELVVKREFSGDSKRYEAAVSDDGSLLVAIDTTCDEELFLEMRSRVVISSVQKLRKSSGLVMTDVVDMYFEESVGTGVQAAVAKHAVAIAKKLKCLPLPIEFRPSCSRECAREVIRNDDVSKGEVTIIFTVPCVATDYAALVALTGSEAVSESIAMFVQTMSHARVVATTSLDVNVDGIACTLLRDTHYFTSAYDMAMKSQAVRAKHPWLPASLE